ncbi:MAG: GldG family protein, partial [Gemmatimonadetes bacterium]|nr:GldG family protein [Gemmatimonadota bacterium]
MKAYTTPLGLVGAALIVAGGLAYLLNAESGSIGLFNLALGTLMVAAAGLLNPALFRQYGRWLNAFWGGIMVFGIVAMVNFLGNRYPERFDLTEGQLHSLADLTVETLKALDRDVHALAFMEGGENAELELLLAELETYNTRFSYEFIDPDRDPRRTEDYGIRRYDTLVLESGDKQQQITELEEREIVNSLLKLTRERQDRIYLTVGHGERQLASQPDGLEQLKAQLGAINYAVEDSLFLAREGAVPEDCAVLVVAGPRTPLFPVEVEAIRSYLAAGGAVLLLLDPLADSGLAELLDEWGVAVGDDFVIDTSGIGSLFGLDFTTPVALSYGDHPVTRKHQGVMTFFQLGRSVHFDEGSGRE